MADSETCGEMCDEMQRKQDNGIYTGVYISISTHLHGINETVTGGWEGVSLTTRNTFNKEARKQAKIIHSRPISTDLRTELQIIENHLKSKKKTPR